MDFTSAADMNVNTNGSRMFLNFERLHYIGIYYPLAYALIEEFLRGWRSGQVIYATLEASFLRQILSISVPLPSL